MFIYISTASCIILSFQTINSGPFEFEISKVKCIAVFCISTFLHFIFNDNGQSQYGRHDIFIRETLTSPDTLLLLPCLVSTIFAVN